ncbi:MAG: hypothetical protein A2268_05290 [Candidatus Raymondbacteria bacterium RifOxyA12_full_50_37]|uniref:YutG/PgpA domain-containing protein n=1 Tax=Candidatus Raymondbacteria bacterium RIFOXYD12_FULL_49_13 TaxID=1817890 RepID=A0A1F7FBZ8_UNCRA|nr:MAG: hypothetical protein A2268_05290 [Candidatus Raymondbacteria bacterium RifOxyA12_full_50_37]OGJ88981.1 MAG: hypothetical protein A2248_02525 [Candidatus Raymondbacteria bacterium RIFOXYA2_FULL_49_16]OGJ97009.1 MAG: hypothetical protein A2453_03945 [Candidatus Raymondbacteria bacterium RIFOXYC2_FULL_50_21]OGK04007.1 MAG: hypothetical protein A2519_00685 [Candidatus Raymondbacteria bacterium RIFOXYD12_FULL_49_13]OGK04070.1 MAG: hypothetical protein A2350_04140 [Candidatus Raymondbacteria 
MRFIAYCIGTFFFAGKAPIASGTAGSFAALIPLAAAAMFAPAPLFSVILSCGILFFIAAGIPAAAYIENAEGVRDPGIVVIDEAAGQWVTFLFVPPAVIIAHWWVLPAGFFLFRFFDITKVFPIRRAEDLPGGVGIMMDDVLAGMYACALLNLLVRFAA